MSPAARSTRDLAHLVDDHMEAHFPETSTGDWEVARDQRDDTAVVIWRARDWGGVDGIRGTMLWRWLGSLRDAGFDTQARLDMAVFGRPHLLSTNRAHYLQVTGWANPDDPADRIACVLHTEPLPIACHVCSVPLPGGPWTDPEPASERAAADGWPGGGHGAWLCPAADDPHRTAHRALAERRAVDMPSEGRRFLAAAEAAGA